MPHVEIICNQMQSDEIDIFKVHEYIANFNIAILAIRNSKYCETACVTAYVLIWRKIILLLSI